VRLYRPRFDVGEEPRPAASPVCRCAVDLASAGSDLPAYPAQERSRPRGSQAQLVGAEPKASREAVSLDGRGPANYPGDVG
jgi:hypothetical protein